MTRQFVIVFIVVLVNVTTDILHLIGLLMRNHFLLLPFFVTSIIRTIAIIFIVFSLWSLFGASITAVLMEVCVLITYGIATIYIFGINCILYKRFSGIYYEKVNEENPTENTVSFSTEVENVEIIISNNPENLDKITIENPVEVSVEIENNEVLNVDTQCDEAG